MEAFSWATALADVDFAGVFADIKSIIPIIAGPVVGFIGFRKAWGFLKGQLRGA